MPHHRRSLIKKPEVVVVERTEKLSASSSENSIASTEALSEFPITKDTFKNLSQIYKDLPSNSSILSDQFEKSFTISTGSKSKSSSRNQSLNQSTSLDQSQSCLTEDIELDHSFESDLEKSDLVTTDINKNQTKSHGNLDLNLNVDLDQKSEFSTFSDLASILSSNLTLTSKFESYTLNDFSDDDTYKVYQYDKKFKRNDQSSKYNSKKKQKKAQKFGESNQEKRGQFGKCYSPRSAQEGGREKRGQEKFQKSAKPGGNTWSSDKKRKEENQAFSKSNKKSLASSKLPPSQSGTDSCSFKTKDQAQNIKALSGRQPWQGSRLCEKILQNQALLTLTSSRQKNGLHGAKIAAANEYLTCPFDPQHKVSQKFYRHHVFNCRDYFAPETEILICPYNSRHLLLEKNYKDHVCNCVDQNSYLGEIANGMAETAVDVDV